MTLKGCADPMEEVRGALFGLMAAHGAPEIIEQFGIVCERLGCSAARVRQANEALERGQGVMLLRYRKRLRPLLVGARSASGVAGNFLPRVAAR